MRKGLLLFAPLCAALLAGSWARPQSILDVASGAVAPPPSTNFFPLSQVHRGLRGTAYTVFEGTEPEAMDVEILGLLHNALGPHQDMILARLHGTKPEYSGVVAGMSGSPVYVDGKLLGALAYRIGEFSKEPIAGITPIEQMLQVRDESRGPELMAQAGDSPLKPIAGLTGTPGTELKAQADGSQVITPIETPLVFTGFSPEALQFWKEHATGLGLAPVAGMGGGSGSDTMTAVTPGSVVPGSAISAVLIRGDLEISATCTVTYVDPKRLLACGHPITQFGPVSMPMAKAEVVATVPSPFNAFKIINTTDTVGSFIEDRETAILGEFGKPARVIPLTMRLAQDGATEKPRTLHLEVIDQEQLTPLAVMVSLFQSLVQTNGYAVETTYRVRGRVKLAGYPEVKFENLVAPTDFAPANLVAALALGERFNRLYANAARRTPIESVEVDVDAIPGRHTAQIENAQAGGMIVHAGDTISVEATVRPWRGELKNIRIPVTLPATLPDGPVRLLVSDGGTLDRLMQPPQIGGSNLDVSATIAQLNSLHANDRLYVTLLAPDAQAAIDGRTLTALPLSMANVLEPVRDNRGMTLNGESAVPLASVALDAVLSGQQVVTLRIE
ncbi:MAG: SpoIVB peptidase S55 [Acidobacteriaceae bacterium]|nr:SpoIVB peptidase S55 [Acidobacteriaceae bacterium]